MIKLAGTCNQCGLCCMDGDARCHNLRITGVLGTPGATTCMVYGARYAGMPVMLVSPENVVISLGECNHGDEEADNQAILEKGIGKGCSLRLVS